MIRDLKNVLDEKGICNSCGAIRKTKVTNNRRFIQVSLEDTQDPYDDGKTKIDVIQTKNGRVTVGVRYVW